MRASSEWWHRVELRLLALNEVAYAACSMTALVSAFHEHDRAQRFLDPRQPEREWGYGQIVAVALLLTPVLTFVEGLSG